MDKAKEAVEEIKTTTGNGNISAEILDLASFKSVRDFTSKISQNERRIDILINNAGKITFFKVISQKKK